jgi:two-component sensor histidine kinase
VGPYAIGGDSGEPIVVAATPVVDSDGGAVGLLTATISLTWIQKLAVDIDLPNGSRIILIDRSGHPLVGEDAPRGAILPAHDILDTYLKLEPEAFISEGADGQPRFYGLASLQDSGMRLILALPQSVVMSQATEGFLRQLLGLVAIWLAALATGWFAVELLVTRWLKSLSQTAAAISAGDFSAKPAMPRVRSEIRQLTRTFGLMTSRIRSRDENLRRAVAEREVLIREIHHRVKNNLQLINSLMNLQMRGIDHADVKSSLLDMQARIRALSLVHNQLYDGDDLGEVDLRRLLSDLCGHLVSANSKLAERVRCSVQAPSRPVSMDTAIPLALLTTEAVMNATKYAFPGDAKGEIAVTVRELGDRIEMRLADDGIGMAPADMEVAQRSLGIRLIRALSGQLRAELSVEGPPGLAYVLRMDSKRLFA